MNVLEGKLVAGKGKFAIVAARFNEFIVSKLIAGAEDTLVRHGVDTDDITLAWVPGAFEIPLAAQKLAQSEQYLSLIHICGRYRRSRSRPGCGPDLLFAALVFPPYVARRAGFAFQKRIKRKAPAANEQNAPLQRTPLSVLLL